VFCLPLAVGACGLGLQGLEDAPGPSVEDDASGVASSGPDASAPDAGSTAATDSTTLDAFVPSDAFPPPDGSSLPEAGFPEAAAPTDSNGIPESPVGPPDDVVSPAEASSFPDAPVSDGAEDDGTLPNADSGPPACNPTSPFGAPVLVAGLESTASEGGLRLTPDETTGFFWSTRAGGPGTTNLYVATRPDRTVAFANITLLSSIDIAGNQYDPTVTADALTLAFGSDRASTDGTYDLFLATRANTADDFGGVTPLSTLNTSSNDQQPFLLPDGSEIYFSSDRSGDSDIYRAFAAAGGGFGPPSAVTEINTAGIADEHPVASADDLTIFFSSTRAGGIGNIDVWTATRANASSTFGTITDVQPVNTTSKDIPDWISPDGCRLYLHSDRDGGSPHEYVATRSP
jgi:Tol biopolymer transport system component